MGKASLICVWGPVGRDLRTGLYRFECRECRAVVEVPFSSLTRNCGVARPAVERPPCLLRGEETRRVLCESCCGRVLVKVFACGLHGECTVSKAAAGVARCYVCPDHVPAVGPAD
jgi:hypothetical protein